MNCEFPSEVKGSVLTHKRARGGGGGGDDGVYGGQQPEGERMRELIVMHAMP